MTLAAPIADLIQSYGYLAVAVGTFLEGETFLLLGGAAAAHGHLSLPIVIGIATCASFLGDQLFFLVGQQYGTTLLARFPKLEPRAQQVRQLLHKHHLPLILSIRFLYGLRVAGPITLGMSHVPWGRFLALNAVGAVVWASVIGGMGYGAGRMLSTVLRGLDADEWWGIAALTAVGLWWLAIRLHKRRARLPD